MIEVQKSPTADSRTADGKITKEELKKSTEMHISDVKAGLKFISTLINKRADNKTEYHDHTKIEHLDDFYDALTSGDIKNSEWYKLHVTNERHHLKSKAPDNVNIIDVIEHIVDCTMAGITRSGQVYDLDIPNDILQRAINNTKDLIIKETKVINESTSDDIMNSFID